MPPKQDQDSTAGDSSSGESTTLEQSGADTISGAPAADDLSPAGGETQASPAEAASSPADSAADAAAAAAGEDAFVGDVADVVVTPRTGVGHMVWFYSTNLDLTGLADAVDGVPALVTRVSGSGAVDLTVFRANGANPIGLAGIEHADGTTRSTYWLPN